MKSKFLDFVLYSLGAWQVSACALQSSYSDCFNKNTLKVMNCETMNAGPMADYYSCLCENKRNLYNCYAICADDATLQLQAQNFQLDVTNTCQQAGNYKAIQATTSSSIPTTMSTSSTPIVPITVTTIARPSATTSLSNVLSTGTKTMSKDRPAVTILTNDGTHERWRTDSAYIAAMLGWMFLFLFSVHIS